MSHRTEGSLGVVKSVSGIAGVTFTVIVLITCGANLHAKPSAPPNDQSALATNTSESTEVARNLTINSGVHANGVVTGPTEDVGDITASDGFIAANVTLSPFDVDQPAVGKLKRDLLDAIQRAAADAATDGIEIRINSGWRSARYQQYLLNAAVLKYGSEQEARKWVSTPEKSSHVAGNAVDIAPTDADDWLLRHGSRYGLCQIYANERWHFELAVAPGSRCPPPKADASDG